MARYLLALVIKTNSSIHILLLSNNFATPCLVLLPAYLPGSKTGLTWESVRTLLRITRLGKVIGSHIWSLFAPIHMKI